MRVTAVEAGRVVQVQVTEDDDLQAEGRRVGGQFLHPLVQQLHIRSHAGAGRLGRQGDFIHL
ncbi:hypothetical protein D3C71_2202470 [compost metagenome]